MDALGPALHRLIKQKSYNDGFTLIEIVAVLVVIGVTFALAALSMGKSDSFILNSEARRFAVILEQTRQEAIVRSEKIAVALRGPKFRFLRFNEKNQWKPFSDDYFREGSLEGGVMPVGLTVNRSRSPIKEHLVFNPSGYSLPFSLTLGYKNEKVAINVDPLGRVDVIGSGG